MTDLNRFKAQLKSIYLWLRDGFGFVSECFEASSAPSLFIGSVAVGFMAIALPGLLSFLARWVFPVMATYAVFLLLLGLWRLWKVQQR